MVSYDPPAPIVSLPTFPSTFTFFVLFSEHVVSEHPHPKPLTSLEEPLSEDEDEVSVDEVLEVELLEVELLEVELLSSEVVIVSLQQVLAARDLLTKQLSDCVKLSAASPMKANTPTDNLIFFIFLFLINTKFYSPNAFNVYGFKQYGNQHLPFVFFFLNILKKTKVLPLHLK